jgi:hypothetical protein
MINRTSVQGEVPNRLLARLQLLAPYSVMRRNLHFAILAVVLTAITSQAQTPPSAEELLAQARTKAAAEHKSIFVVFDASW